MSAAIFCPHCKLKYDKAVRLRRHRDFWICSSCAEHYHRRNAGHWRARTPHGRFWQRPTTLKSWHGGRRHEGSDIWKRPWLAVLLLFLCFLLVGYFERQDQELFERMAPFTEVMR